MTRRLALGAVLGLGVAGIALAASQGALPDLAMAGASSGPTPAPSADVVTAEVERRTLQTEDVLDGTLGYEGSRAVLAGGAGTVTRVPDAGDVIGRGEVLYELDGRQRPRLLYGERPMWRALGPGVSNGPDVEQLERNLKALGYAPKGMKVDRDWDARTAQAVRRWQRATGQVRDGVVDPADIVFLPFAIRVASVEASTGSRVAPGAPVLDATTVDQVVTVDLDADDRELVAEGQAVTVELPDGREVAATIEDVGRVAVVSPEGGPTTIPVTIQLAGDADPPDLDQSPVSVRVVTEERAGVLAVPVHALVALLEGGYAVEVVEEDGSHRYLAVELGLFDDGMVEVEGDGLEAGDDVVVPR